ncbi:MAG: gingipain R, partial [Candidatus Cloacimonetes bacterium]|nr:gingipain R [Candidatus Cloacimonadota bacterium]
PAIMRDFRIVNVTVNPFQYDPKSKELKIITNINFVVNIDGTGGDNIKICERKISRFFEPLYKAVILNYDEIIAGREEVYQDPSYLFIFPTVSQVETNLQDLVDWKHQKGFEVSTQGFTSGTSYSTIKSYIQTAYDTWENPPEFVCLVGDAGGSYNIPSGSYSYGPGDQVYALLEGGDILADVFIGRLSFNSIIEFQTIIAKILNYEKEPYMTQTNWYQQALLVGDPSSSEHSCIVTNKYIKEIIEANAPYYNYYEVYSSPFVSQMNSAINNGVTYFNYRGYLGMSGWGNDDIGSLNNGFKLPVMVFLTCGTGDFTGTYNCESEYALKVGTPSVPKGAIAAIGTATMSTHTCFNNCVAA